MNKEYIPKYVRIKNEILNQISNGVLKRGDLLPSELELAKQYNVSRITIVGAMRDLVKQGIINKRRKRGTVVCVDRIPENDDYDIFSEISSTPRITISFLLSSNKPNYEFLMRTLAGIFHLENPDIKVEIETADGDFDPLHKRLKNGTLPTAMEFFMHATYAANDKLLPLDAFEGFQETVSMIHPELLYHTADSTGAPHYHGIPVRRGVSYIQVNQRMLEAAGIRNMDEPMTSERLTDWIKKLSIYTESRKNGEYSYFLGNPQGFHNVIGLLPFLWQGIPNGEYTASSRECYRRVFSTPECVEGLAFLQRLKRNYISAPDNGLDLFALGKVGILLSSDGWLLSLNAMMHSPIPIRAYPIPPLPGMQAFSASQGGTFLGILRSPENTRQKQLAAWKWIRFLLRRKQQYLLTTDYTSPVRCDCSSLLQHRFPEISRLCDEIYKNIRPQFDFVHVRETLAMTGIHINRLFDGTLTPQECARHICDELR